MNHHDTYTTRRNRLQGGHCPRCGYRLSNFRIENRCFNYDYKEWPAPGSEDTELGVLMELEVGHGETEVYAGVQA
jgi:hypothetical protein